MPLLLSTGRRAALAVLLFAAAAHAQDFEMPDFAAAPDGGATVPEPTPPPPPPASVTGVSPDGGTAAPDAGVPAPPTLGPFSGHFGAFVLANQFIQLGVEGAFGKVLAAPPAPKAGSDQVGGFVVIPGVEASFGRITSASSCGGTIFCGSRFTAGPMVKVGWASGVPGLGGWTRLQTMYFAQLGAMFGYSWIPSAPLAPGSQSVELVLRGRVGLHWSVFGSQTVTAKSGTLMAALLVEGIPLGGFTRGVLFGGTVGLAF